MHLPDGFLDAKTALLSSGAAVAGVSVAVRHVRTSLEASKMPLLGLAAAFVFAAQMVNFPIAGGTSGHLIGGVLTAVLLGPGAAVLVISCVLIVQCLVFADGGLMALGANVFNMALVSVCGGYGVFVFVRRLIPMAPERSTIFAAAFAGWFGTVLASICCAGELALSGTVAWRLAFPAMLNVHMLIGIGEGLATGLIVQGVFRSRPELLAGARETRLVFTRFFWGYALLIIAGLAMFVAPFACRWPDGLESVATALGFKGKATAPTMEGPLADYRLPLIGSPIAATAVAGMIGTLLAFVAAYLLGRFLGRGLPMPKKDAPTGN
jgi:cobalt/nickel transport system permease protein